MAKKKKFEFPANTPEWIKRIDWTDLRTQKSALIEVMNTVTTVEQGQQLEGILALIDALQDYAVDELSVPEMHVFDFELEDERDNPDPDKTKQIWLCGSCGSNNVETKNWINPNTGKVGTDCEDEMAYCQDCELHSELILSDVKANAKVIGFQVVGDAGTAEDGEIHPMMDASFCLYSLSQAREMLKDDENDDEQWKLLAIWTGDIEEPTFMFEGDPRD